MLGLPILLGDEEYERVVHAAARAVAVPAAAPPTGQ